MILLPANCSNEFNSEGANVAIVFVDLKELEKRVARAIDQKKIDKSLAKMCYWDDRVMFYRLSDQQLAELVVAADAKIGECLFFREPNDLMEKYGDPIRIDCEQMTVWERNGVSWFAYDHYGSDSMETDRISLDTIRALTKTKKRK